MLANETGKGRATQTATSRRTHTWRILFLSDGEVSLANHMSEAGKGARGGHDVRMAHIAADAGKGYGVYDTLHDFADGAALSNHLVSMSHQYYGVAGMAFIERAVASAGKLSETLRSRVNNLTQEICPAGAHGQVSRVASRFALVGIAGEMATAAGITGWTQGEAQAAARNCFNAWLDGRGGAGNTEHSSIIRQVSGFFQVHGDARFVWWHRANDDRKPNTINRAGLALQRAGHYAFSDKRLSRIDEVFEATVSEHHVGRRSSKSRKDRQGAG
jgi:putative DNA primase/helicase